MVRFAHPYFLILILLIPLLIWRYLQLQNRRASSVRFSDLGIFKKLPTSKSVKARHLLIILRNIILLLLILALARPQSGSKHDEILTEGIDIMLTLDISDSMRAEDFKPLNRIQVAKQVVAEFIKGRHNDRLGLVIFAADSYTQCPLTLDYGVLLSFLEHVQIGLIDQRATAVGMAIANCVNRLRDSKAKSKVIILLTDGRNNTGEIDPVTAAQLAKAMQIKIYTIGAGKPGDALFPIEDPIFGKRYVRMQSDLDENTLKKIAEVTGGQYFRATNADALSEIYKKIDQMEKTEIKVKEYTRYSELFYYFLYPALVLLLLEQFLSYTRFRKLP